MSLQKTRFAQQMISLHQKLSEVMDLAGAMEKEYFDRGYNSAGSDEIEDNDVVNLGITASNIASGITLLQQQDKFFTNQAVSAADYAVTVNMFRRAGA